MKVELIVVAIEYGKVALFDKTVVDNPSTGSDGFLTHYVD
jgi:hypothetical protein